MASPRRHENSTSAQIEQVGSFVHRSAVNAHVYVVRPSRAIGPFSQRGQSRKRPKSSRLRALHFGSGGGIRTPDLRVMSVEPRVGDFAMLSGCCRVRPKKCLCWMVLVCANPPQQSPHAKWCYRGAILDGGGGHSDPPRNSATVHLFGNALGPFVFALPTSICPHLIRAGAPCRMLSPHARTRPSRHLWSKWGSHA
jgi:hypothetical protein